MQASSQTYSTGQIAQMLTARLVGDANVMVDKIAPVDSAQHGAITFVSDRKYLTHLSRTKASAIILSAEFCDATTLPCLVVDNPYLAYARLSGFFQPAGPPAGQVHASARIDPAASLPADAVIGANVVIERHVTLGTGCRIGAGAVIGAGSVLGNRVLIHSNATVLHGCSMGDDCEVHSGAVIGADGFGWAHSKDGWVKIHQLGGVRIGNRVSVGANTCIDRGALTDTVIEDGVILDNLIQIAHNVHIGQNTAIAGCVGIAGSTRIGCNCTIAGAVGIVGHLEICDHVHVSAKSFVNRSITEAGSYSSAYPLEPTRLWRRNAVRLRRLDEMARRLGKLENGDKS